ncbi:hypothetical protein ACFVYF_09960 [Streptomyces sp. NPDC058274]|uniref:hypothetical protein n=1 Tax=Streptomyces sp. NPDC058274 TaxID=3346416 RepID=UPI0036E4DF8F
MDERPLDTRGLIDELEGHLLVEAARTEARAEAARFSRSLAWLTDTQRAEVEERYADNHLAVTRRSWERTARRGGELKAEYEAAYRALRRRLCGGILLGAVVIVMVTAGLAATR